VKKDTKAQIIRDLAGDFSANGTYYLVDFKTMKVSQAVELRKLLRKNAYTYKVVKNRLALRALQETCPEPLKRFFEKPTAVAFSSEDPIGLARILREFSAQGKVLAVKAGVVEGVYMDPEQFEEIARLNSRKDLVGKIGFLMAYPLTRLMRTLQAPLGNLGVLLGQLKSKKEN
jgi:large subunit ribosomal protein L10